MSFISDIFSGSKGSGFQAQSAGPINYINAEGINAAGQPARDTIKGYQDFVNAVQAQNGLQNQSNVFNQLQGVANGTGPNPAQAMLNQATGANVANQAALMASQRGVGANPGLIARQAAQQGANTQQQAVGQGATMQANQSLNALGQLANVSGQQAGQLQAAQSGLGALTQNNLATNLSAIDAQNRANISNAQQQNQSNSAVAQQNAKGQGNLLGGAINGIGSVLGLAEGGEVPDPLNDLPDATKTLKLGKPVSKMAQALLNPSDSSGSEGPQDSMSQAGDTIGSGIGQGLSAIGSGIGQGINSLFSSKQTGGSGNSITSGSAGPAMTMMAAKGGKVAAKVSPGEIYLSPDKAKKVAQGKMSPLAGERIPGKAKVQGDSYDNDTVSKTLKEGGVVVPRSKALGSDVERKAADFVAAVLSRSKLGK